MLKPLFRTYSDKSVSLIELLDRVGVRNVWYEKNTFAPVSIYPIIATGSLSGYWNWPATCTHGGQLAIPYWTASTVYSNQFDLTKVTPAYQIDDETYAITMWNSGINTVLYKPENEQWTQIGVDGYARVNALNYFDETNNRLIVVYHHGYYNRTYWSVSDYNNGSLSYRWQSVDNSMPQVLHIEEGQYMLITVNEWRSRARFWILDFINPESNNNIANITANGQRGKMLPTVVRVREIDGKLWFVYLARGNNQKSLVFKSVFFDPNKRQVVSQVDATVIDQPDLNLPPEQAWSTLQAFVTVTSGENPKTFLHVVSTVDTPGGVHGMQYCWIATYEIADVDKFVFRSLTPLYTETEGVLFLNPDDRKTLWITSSVGVNKVAVFDDNSAEWTVSDLGFSKSIASIVDNQGRILAFTASSDFYLLVPTIPVRVEIRTEKTSYIYTGVNINTKVFVSAYNFFNQRISVTGKLRILTDNAVFDNGQKVKEITTSATEDVVVPITITGPGLVSLYFDYTFNA